jgi:hypothetical protein
MIEDHAAASLLGVHGGPPQINYSYVTSTNNNFQIVMLTVFLICASYI